MSQVPIIKLENLAKAYKNVKAVDNVNLKVNKGDIIGLIGPNGAGKTTTIKLIARLNFPDEGYIYIQNKSGELQNIQENSENLISQGYLVDIPHFYPLTPNQMLTYFARIQGYPEESIQERINSLLKQFKLYEWKHENVKTFSKGMAQKLGLIQAVIHDPEFIILDEPQTGLDPKARIEVRNFIRKLKNEVKTIFLSSHLLYEITELCDKIALINHGKIIAYDTIQKLEGKIKVKELECKLTNSISQTDKEKILSKLYHELNPYLDVTISAENRELTDLINYEEENKILKIRYAGGDKEKNKILNILVSKFNEDLPISSFSETKISKLEKIYSELVLDEK